MDSHGVGEKDLKQATLGDPETAIALCDHEWNYPLFLDDSSLYYQHQEGLQAISVVAERIRQLDTIDVGYQNTVEGFEWGKSPATVDDLLVCAGVPLLNLLAEATFVLPWRTLGFLSFEECLAVTSAHIVNERDFTCFNEMRGWRTTHRHGFEVVNRFARYIHGDFRFHQYWIPSEFQGPSPWGDRLRLSVTRCKTISAYHSVECAFMAILLRYLSQCELKSAVLANYSDFSKTLLDQGACLGLFADAGLVSSVYELCQLECPLPTNSGAPSFQHRLPKENEGAETAWLDLDTLCFSPSGTRFLPVDLDPLIKGLHESCRMGWGRTSLQNLTDFTEKALLEAKMLEAKVDFL